MLVAALLAITTFIEVIPFLPAAMADVMQECDVSDVRLFKSILDVDVRGIPVAGRGVDDPGAGGIERRIEVGALGREADLSQIPGAVQRADPGALVQSDLAI